MSSHASAAAAPLSPVKANTDASDKPSDETAVNNAEKSTAHNRKANKGKDRRVNTMGSSPIQFAATNPVYPDETPGLGYPSLTPGLIVEPYRETQLEASATSDDTELDTCSWTILQTTGVDSDSIYPFTTDSFSLDGASVSHTFTAPATYHVSTTCTTTTGDIHTVASNVECIYIRRELRDLSTDDLDAFLTAFHTLSSVSTEEGRATYGSNYHSLDHFVQMHLNAASHRSHDQIHDGMGVVTQHASITSKIELTLQTIDPTISIPYWDYTKDSAHMKLSYRGDTSSLFKSEWWVHHFGATNELDHHISTGLFANQMVGLANASNPSAAHSPYGYLRAPWNLNPSRLVTRFHKQCGVSPASTYSWPTCMNHWSLTFKKKTWYDWIWDVSYSPHGPVHVWIGGVGGGCESMDLSSFDSSITEKETDLKNMMFVFLKNLWRSEKIEVPKSCSADNEESCVIKCNSEKENKDEFLRKFEYEVKEMVSLDLSVYDNETVMALADEMICGKAFWSGDHLEASSPVEASFWPIHPTLDRLLQYKLIVDGFAEDHWELSESSSKMYCEYRTTSDCKGHHPGDLTFSSVITRDEGVYKSTYVTNYELRSALTPDTYSVPYIYNNFEWEHCNSLEGVSTYFPSVSESR
jgi:hypothetical protein